MRGLRALERSVYAHGMEVAVSFYFTHTGIANYCIPAGRVSATLSRACMKGAGHETRIRRRAGDKQYHSDDRYTSDRASSGRRMMMMRQMRTLRQLMELM